MFNVINSVTLLCMKSDKSPQTWNKAIGNSIIKFARNDLDLHDAISLFVNNDKNELQLVWLISEETVIAMHLVQCKQCCMCQCTPQPQPEEDPVWLICSFFSSVICYICNREFCQTVLDVTLYWLQFVL